MNLNKYVLDSSALLAVFGNEPGAEQIWPLLEDSVISAVNFSECIAKITLASERNAPVEEARIALNDLARHIVPFDESMAKIAGEMAAKTQQFGLSLGDRACLATAEHLDLEAVTADKVWGKLKLPIKIKVIR